jgi:hypothetical protein
MLSFAAVKPSPTQIISYVLGSDLASEVRKKEPQLRTADESSPYL